MEKKALYEDASIAVQRFLLLTVLALETAVAHLLAAGTLYLTGAGVTGIAGMLPFIATVGVYVLIVGMNLGSIIASVRIIWFEKEDPGGWKPFARFALPFVLGQTTLSLAVWLLYPMHIQFIVGSSALFLTGLFFTLLRRSARRMPEPPDTENGGDA